MFSEHAVKTGIEALRAGCDIVTDTQMAKAGINKTILASLGGEVHCFMSDADVAAEAKARGVTRAFVSMEKAARLQKPCIFAIGNAPTALAALEELMEADALHPALHHRARPQGRQQCRCRDLQRTALPDPALRWKNTSSRTEKSSVSATRPAPARRLPQRRQRGCS